MQQAKQLVHGTCVAFGAHAALLRGSSGSGKSDLALRFLALPADGGMAPRLVADDQVVVEAQAGGLVVSAPDTLAGKLEVRGLGIMTLPHVTQAKLVLIVDFVAERRGAEDAAGAVTARDLVGGERAQSATCAIRGVGAAQAENGAYFGSVLKARFPIASGLRHRARPTKIAPFTGGKLRGAT